MVKKTAKSTKSNVQRSREEQWKRRAAAQGVAVGTSTTGATIDLDDDSVEAPSDGYASTNTAPRSATFVAPKTGSSSRVRTGAAVAATSGAARRATQAARPGRMRVASNAMSVEDEMRYVRSDIRLLIILTLICLAILIVLAFVIR